MFGTFLYFLSIGVIGVVSYIWLKPHLDQAKSTDDQQSKNRRKGETAQPPALPPRIATKTKSESTSTSSPTPSPPTAHSSNKNGKKTDGANLLSLALNTPPSLPKRPMVNILRAPTLTKSFSPSPHNGPTITDPVVYKSDSPSGDDKSSELRKQVVWEIVSSEEKYLECLNTLMSVYFHPLKAKVEKGSNKLTQTDFALIFSNIESIWKFHQTFRAELKTSPDGDVAATLAKHADYMKMYTKYVADYSPALQTMNKLYRNPDFVRFLKRQRDSPASEGMDIMSFLICPIQRIPRYVLLLRELKKYTPPSHPHARSIELAIEKISKIATHINEQQRHHENASILLEFQHQIHNLAVDIQLFQPHRRLVRHGLLTLLKQEGTATSTFQLTDLGKPFVFILFNDMILYTTDDHDYRGMMKLQGARVTSDNLTIELLKPKTETHRAPVILKVECPSLEENDKWTQSFQESIQAANELIEKDERRRSAASNSISIAH